MFSIFTKYTKNSNEFIIEEILRKILSDMDELKTENINIAIKETLN